MAKTYVCPDCKATKTLIRHEDMSVEEFEASLPEKVPCGWRGCFGYALPKGG